MTLMHVVLPEPLGPTRPRISPGMRWKLSPSSARKAPKRLTRPSTRRSGSPAAAFARSRDIDAPAPEERDEAVRQEQHEAHDEQPVDELEVLRSRDADRVVDAVENDDAEDRPGDGGDAAEEREDDGEDAEIRAEHGLRIEDRDVPGEDSADEAGDERAQEPGNHAPAHHVDARHAGADRILADRLEREPEARVAQIDDEAKGQGHEGDRRAIAQIGAEYAREADAVRALGDVLEVRVRDDLEHGERGREIGDGEISPREAQERGEQEAEQECRERTRAEGGEWGHVKMDDGEREAVGTRAEEARVAEGQVAGKAVDDVDPLRQGQEHHEIEEEELVRVEKRQECRRHYDRHEDEERVAECSRHGAPAARGARSAAPEG